MKNAIVYYKSTGKIFELVSTDDVGLRAVLSRLDPEMDYFMIDTNESCNIISQYVDTATKTLVYFPDKTSEFHTWDWTTKQWVLDSENAAQLIRQKRDELLRQSDWSQGLDVPENLRTVWAVYRDALRHIPEQEGFPEQVTWPTPPEGT